MGREKEIMREIGVKETIIARGGKKLWREGERENEEGERMRQ